MKVKEIIIPALRYAGREDVSVVIESGTPPEGEIAEAVKTALYCFNAVEDELARSYFSLTFEETLTSGDGVYSFSTFGRIPVKIISVKAGGKETSYTLRPDCIECGERKISVKYGYVPDKKGLDGESEFSEGVIPLKLLAAGTASEFCLVCGDTGRAELWENVYREEIDGVRRRKLLEAKLPPRRWV